MADYKEYIPKANKGDLRKATKDGTKYDYIGTVNIEKPGVHMVFGYVNEYTIKNGDHAGEQRKSIGLSFMKKDDSSSQKPAYTPPVSTGSAPVEDLPF